MSPGEIWKVGVCVCVREREREREMERTCFSNIEGEVKNRRSDNGSGRREKENSLVH